MRVGHKWDPKGGYANDTLNDAAANEKRWVDYASDGVADPASKLEISNSVRG